MHRKWAIAVGSLAFLVPRPAAAMVRSDVPLGPIRAHVYAPDWIWQGLHVNVFVVLDNIGPSPAEVQVELRGDVDRLLALEPDKASTTLAVVRMVPPGQTVRAALAHLPVRGDAATGPYALALALTGAGRTQEIPYRLEVVRGPAVKRDEWMIWMLSAVFLGWAVLMGWVLGRFSVPGAWKTAGPVFQGDAPHGR